jgi:hypothetical protein
MAMKDEANRLSKLSDFPLDDKAILSALHRLISEEGSAKVKGEFSVSTFMLGQHNSHYMHDFWCFISSFADHFNQCLLVIFTIRCRVECGNSVGVFDHQYSFKGANFQH